ncbi:MAG TPA: CotH kinase family protein [Candidatus Binatia bacterium]|nr:CotH kinase family protein [Candidatus Binatia bacterium]
MMFSERSKFLWRFALLVTLLLATAALFAMQPRRNAILIQQHALGQFQGGKWLKRLTERLQDGGDAAAISAPEVDADFASGFYPRPLRVALASDAGKAIHYTLDGSTPDAASAIYNQPITIERTAVLRFRSFSAAGAPGPVELSSFVIGADYALPVFSLVLDPVHLWNRHAGIYVNYKKRGAKWQRPAHVEYLEGRQGQAMRFPAEAGIHGNFTRESRKKSFQLSYSSSALERPDNGQLLKPETSAGKRAVVLRAAGIDVNYRLGHELFRSTYAAAGGLVPRSAAVMLLLNGTPWGVYHLQSKIDKDYLRERFGVGSYEIAEWPDHEPNPASWRNLLELTARLNLADDAEFRRIAQLIDIENFTDYLLFNIFAGNYDWPHNNHLAFRKTDGSHPWRWLSWDSDAAFNAELGAEHRTLEWSVRERRRDDLAYGGVGRHQDEDRYLASTQLMRSLLRNSDYRERFYGRFKQLLVRDFAPAQLRERFDRLVSELEPHLGVDWALWPRSRENFVDGVDAVRRFIDNRPRHVRRQFQEYFGRTD